jgi:Na+-translocating ferredoxin:NAD+ oxidoreductase RNF subunit RnfB
MTLLLPTALVAVIGLIFGIILAVASKVMAVPIDEISEAVLGVLPGANCGGCGFSGCSGYASAISQKGAEINLCPPGGADVAAKIAAILGVETDFVKKGAFVKCLGTIEKTSVKGYYQGEFSCAAAKMYLDGPQLCVYGCIGYGDCAAVCEYDAIKIIGGLATVDLCKCVACGKCARACPKKIIDILPLDSGKALINCSSHDKAVDTKNNCSAGCIACSRCVKACAAAAIAIKDNVAVVDWNICTACGKCATVCPSGCIGI